MEWNREDFLKRLFAVLRIDAEPTVSDDQVITLAEQRANLIYKGEVDSVVEQQIVEGKIGVDERDFAKKMVLDMGMPVFVAFCKHRKPLATMTAASGMPSRAVISQLQQQINDQLGVSAEVFSKHNGRH